MLNCINSLIFKCPYIWVPYHNRWFFENRPESIGMYQSFYFHRQYALPYGLYLFLQFLQNPQLPPMLSPYPKSRYFEPEWPGLYDGIVSKWPLHRHGTGFRKTERPGTERSLLVSKSIHHDNFVVQLTIWQFHFDIQSYQGFLELRYFFSNLFLLPGIYELLRPTTFSVGSEYAVRRSLPGAIKSRARLKLFKVKRTCPVTSMISTSVIFLPLSGLGTRRTTYSEWLRLAL